MGYETICFILQDQVCTACATIWQGDHLNTEHCVVSQATSNNMRKSFGAKPLRFTPANLVIS
jgi:hypothetical protein